MIKSGLNSRAGGLHHPGVERLARFLRIQSLDCRSKTMRRSWIAAMAVAAVRLKFAYMLFTRCWA
jgi:hypothetical protein